MANLIKIDGAIAEEARPNFTFAGFEIGALPLADANIPSTIRQTFRTTDIDVQNQKTTNISYVDYNRISKNGNPEGAIYIHPQLIQDLNIKVED